MLRMVLGRIALGAAVVTAGLALAACGDSGSNATSESASGAKTVSAIFPDPVNSGNWSPAGFEAFEAMVREHDFTASTQESVAYDQSASVLRRLAPANDMIIAHSSAYEAAALEVAPQYPDTWFIIYSDLSTTDGLDNVAGWKINWNEMGYLAGTAACLAARSRGETAIGHVNSIPIPAFTHYGGGAQDAAADYGCEYLTKWTDTVDDLGKAQQAAIALVNGGAGVILTSGNAADQGAYRGAAEAGALFVSLHFDESDVAPDNYLTGVTPDFKGSYEEMGNLLATDKLQAKAYPVTVATGGVKYVSGFSNVDKKVEQEIRDVAQRIADGDLVVDPNSEVKP